MIDLVSLTAIALSASHIDLSHRRPKVKQFKMAALCNSLEQNLSCYKFVKSLVIGIVLCHFAGTVRIKKKPVCFSIKIIIAYAICIC